MPAVVAWDKMPGLHQTLDVFHMWFKNLQLFRLQADFTLDAEQIDESLRRAQFQRCGKMEMSTVGFRAPRPKLSEALVYPVHGCYLVTLAAEEKILPSSVVKEMVEVKVVEIEEQQDRKVGKKERRDLSERVTEELLPRAFSRVRQTWAYIDPANHWIVVDAGSPKKGEEMLEWLRKCIDGLRASPLRTQGNASLIMTDWLQSGEPPAIFTIDDDCELKTPGEDGAVVRCSRQDLHADEVRNHLAAGKLVTKLAVTWQDRLSMMVTEDLQVKKLAFLDMLQEQAKESGADNAEEQFDANFAIMTGELANLLPDLIEVMGGEMPQA